MVAPAAPVHADARALRSIHRGKIVTLAFVGLAAAVAAAYQLTRPAGRGNPEDPAKVLVVTKDRPIGTAAVLRDAGFLADEYGWTALLRKAESELETLPESEAKALLELADLFGYGHVVFVDPEPDAFESIAMEGPVERLEDARFAVLSAGDLAFPHRLTVAGDPPPYLADRFAPLIEAMFAQPALAPVLEDDPPSIALVRLADRLSGGIEDLRRIEAARGRVERVRRSYLEIVDSDAAGATAVADPFRAGRAVVLADGSVLLVGRRFRFQTPDAVRVEAAVDDFVEFLHLPQPGAEAVPCAALADEGRAPAVVRPRVVAADDGSSILLVRLDRPAVLFAFDPESSGCPLREVGPIPPPRPHMRYEAARPHGPLVAIPGRHGDLTSLTVVDTRDGSADVLGMVPDYDLGAFRFLDDRYVVAVLRPRSSEVEPVDRIAVFDRNHPLVVHDLDPRVLDGLTRVRDLAVARVDRRPRLLIVGDGVPSPVFTVDRLADELDRADAASVPDAGRDGVVPAVVAVEGDALEVGRVPVQGFVVGIAPMRGGARAVFLVEDAGGSGASLLGLAHLAGPGAGRGLVPLALPEGVAVRRILPQARDGRIVVDARVRVPGEPRLSVLVPLAIPVP